MKTIVLVIYLFLLLLLYQTRSMVKSPTLPNHSLSPSSIFHKFPSNSCDVVGVMFIPRYLNPFSAHLKLTLFLSSTGKSPESIIAVDLASFVKYPDIFPCSFRQCNSVGIDVDGSDIYVNKSSANKDALCSVPPSSLIPFIFFILSYVGAWESGCLKWTSLEGSIKYSFILIDSANGPILAANNNGLRQPPCLTPLLR